MRCLWAIWFAMACLLPGLGTSSGCAEAGVKDKTYNVTVVKNLVREFDDFYSFQSGGDFAALRGGHGTWNQVNLLVFSVWTAEFGTGFTRVNFIGVQVGPSLTGFGSNQKGDIFQTQGTEGPYDGPDIGPNESEGNPYDPEPVPPPK
jgi:hypothetical protein